MGLTDGYKMRPLVRKRPLLIFSSEKSSDDELDGHNEKGKDVADKGEGTSGSLTTSAPSKCPRLAIEPFVVQEHSPAANNSDREKFLYSLSSDASFKILLDGVLALPTLVSSFFNTCADLSNYSYIIYKTSESPQSSLPISLPVWASWDWAQMYLPDNIHTNLENLHAVLCLLQKYTFVNHSEGTLVILGFGLLLCDCWRAVEVEDDDEHYSKFLQESLLGTKQANQVIKAIKAVISRLPSSNTNVEMPKGKKSDGIAWGQKAGAGQEGESGLRGRSQH